MSSSVTVERCAPERLATFVPAYGGATWAEVSAAMGSWPADAAVVDELRAQLRRDGAFREPVVVDADGGVANGMHRLVAALAEGAAIDVRVGYPDDPIGAELEVTFTVAIVDPVAARHWSVFGDDTDVAFGAACGALRSFPLGDRWVESGGLGASGTVCSAVWHVADDDPLDPDELVAALHARAAIAGVSLEVLSVAPPDDDPADDVAVLDGR